MDNESAFVYKTGMLLLCLLYCNWGLLLVLLRAVLSDWTIVFLFLRRAIFISPGGGPRTLYIQSPDSFSLFSLRLINQYLTLLSLFLGHVVCHYDTAKLYFHWLSLQRLCVWMVILCWSVWIVFLWSDGSIIVFTSNLSVDILWCFAVIMAIFLLQSLLLKLYSSVVVLCGAICYGLYYWIITLLA